MVEVEPVLSKGDVSTHSRAEAAALINTADRSGGSVSTHSRAEAAAPSLRIALVELRFQHTAARRRLLPI